MSKYSLDTCIIPHLGGLCKVRLKEVFFYDYTGKFYQYDFLSNQNPTSCA